MICWAFSQHGAVGTPFALDSHRLGFDVAARQPAMLPFRTTLKIERGARRGDSAAFTAASQLALVLQFALPTTDAPLTFGTSSMNCRQLVHAAIVLAGRRISHLPEREDALRQYWADSQCRLQRWQETIHLIDVEIRNAGDLTVIRGIEHLPMLDELMFTDVLTAVFTGHINTSEQPEPEQNPIVQSVIEGARQARRRTIMLLDSVVKRNSRLRKPQQRLLQVSRGRLRAELWTDILLGYLPSETELASSLGYSNKRIDQYRANIVSLQRQGKLDEFTGKLCRDVGSYFENYPPEISGNEELSQQIFDSMQQALGQNVNAKPSLNGRGLRSAI